MDSLFLFVLLSVGDMSMVDGRNETKSFSGGHIDWPTNISTKAEPALPSPEKNKHEHINPFQCH